MPFILLYSVPVPTPVPVTAPCQPCWFLIFPDRNVFLATPGISFLVQCGLHFELQALYLQTECATVACIIFHLTSRADAWAMAELSKNSTVCCSLALFALSAISFFDHTTPGRGAAGALMALCQDRRQASD